MKATNLILSACFVVPLASPSAFAELSIRQIPGQAELGMVEIHRVSAGSFDPQIWRAGTLNLMPDARVPMLAPRVDGVWRNIYAPSAVETPEGWLLFYGAWDGVDTGNDRIYSVNTTDFLVFDRRQIVVENGTFIHVCNVSAVKTPDQAVHMICTAYPVGDNLNKPAAFRVGLTRQSAGSSDAQPTILKPDEVPIVASTGHLATIEGYQPFAQADINGINTLLLEDGQYRLYFGNFKDFKHVHRASSADGKHFKYDGESLQAALMVNDVKKFMPDGRPCYLMGLHRNGNKLWYALSKDGMNFEAQRELASSTGPQDRYMVAIGWVVQDDCVLGFIYGAGAVPSLDRNRLFARWLQKKLVFTAEDGSQLQASAALGPDRALIPLGDAKELSGKLQVFAEDGQTALSKPLPVKLMSGGVYRLELTLAP